MLDVKITLSYQNVYMFFIEVEKYELRNFHFSKIVTKYASYAILSCSNNYSNYEKIKPKLISAVLRSSHQFPFYY